MNPGTIAAIYTFCAHYHSGQWSRGYRILCRADAAWQRHTGISPRLEYWELLVSNPRYAKSEVATKYRHLVEQHSSNV